MTQIRKTETDQERLAKIANLSEGGGWPRTPTQQATLEHLRVRLAITVIEDPPAAAEEDRSRESSPSSDAAFAREYATFLAADPADAAQVRNRWEKRCLQLDIPLPHEIEAPVAYVVECRRRYRVAKDHRSTTIPYLCDRLADLGVGFGQLRDLCRRHEVGLDTLDKIEILYEDLVAEVAERYQHTEGG